MGICVCTWMRIHVHVTTEARVIRYPGVRIKGGCELPSMSAEDQIRVFCESSMGTEPSLQPHQCNNI